VWQWSATMSWRFAEDMLDPNHRCSGFCHEQVASSLRIARQSPTYSETFFRIADHWAAIAKICDGKLYPETRQCHELPRESNGAYPISSNFVAHVLSTCLPRDRSSEIAREIHTPAEHHHAQLIWHHAALEERERRVDSDLIEIFMARFLNVLSGFWKTEK